MGEGGIESVTDFLIWYFSTIRDHDDGTKSDWGQGRRGYLCTNNGVSSMLFLLDGILRNVRSEFAIRFGSANLKDVAPAKIRDSVAKFLRPSLEHLAGLSADERDSLRKSSSKGQQVLFATELEGKISESIPEFQVVHLKNEAGLPSTHFEALLQEVVARVLREELGERWYREGISKEMREKIASTIRKKGHDPDEFTDDVKLGYSDLGTLSQIIMQRFSTFKSVFRADPQVFGSQMAWMSAYRSGQRTVHTGDTQRYYSMMGRATMGHYMKVLKKYLEPGTVTGTQPATGG